MGGRDPKKTLKIRPYRRVGGTLFWIPRSLKDHVKKIKHADISKSLDLSSIWDQAVEIDVVNNLVKEVEELNIEEQIRRQIVNINKSVRESLPALLLSGFFSLFAGYLMTMMTGELEHFPGLFVLIVPIIGLRGAASSAFASRFSSSFHLGLVDKTMNSFLRGDAMENIKGYLASAILVSILIGFLSYYSCVMQNIPHMSLMLFLVIATISGVLSTLMLGVSVVLLTWWAVNAGWEPANIVIPLLTTLGDIFGVVIVYLVIISLAGAVV